ncbi:MAG TPA: DUF1800 family protein [Vicinamibacterales bacterium]|nr:DUF1800 family protein [Vicinamibacterales bacterium]
MRPLRVVVGVAILFVATASVHGGSTGPFDQKLTRDKEAVQALNRLTYGPRPGDVDEVRRIGVEKWIRRQLNPSQIAQNPALEASLKPLESVQLASWQIFERYQPAPLVVARPSAAQLLPADQLRLLQTGKVEERRKVLTALAPDVRAQVLSTVAPPVLVDLPDFQAEAAKARAAEAQARLAEQRKLRPPLADLLSQDQQRLLQRGSEEERTKLLSSLDREKRTQVLRQVPAQQVPETFKREALAARQPQQVVSSELIEAKLYRALQSNRQLEEVLVDFWLNHFNVFNGKGSVRMLLPSYERDAIRPHVLGRFRDMLLATARHPAMLFYLDNWQSRAAPDASPLNIVVPVGAPRPGLNENYGRELMELHTLGVDGGYTQADVINVARCFTGWTIFDPNRYGEFQFNPVMHDRGEKVVLGQTIARGGGEDDGLKVIDILARHPSTARFISRKLAQRFVSDDPPKPLVDRMAETFRKTDGDLRAVTETMLLSREFLSEGAFRGKLKSPLEMVVSSLRALNANVTDTTALAQRIADLGQPLYGKQEPTGYPNTSETWASSAGLLGRMNFATALTAGQIAGVKVDTSALASSDPRRAVTQLLGVEPSAATLAALQQGFDGKPPAPAVLATVLIASPDFQKR